MHDNELITTMKESFTGIHSATPVERIVSRGRTVRARRRICGMAGAAAAVAGAALAGTALLPASHPADAHLAAYTVAKQANGTIEVTIRELRDPAGLQQTLRADGVPASVTYAGHPNLSCQAYPGKWEMGGLGTQGSGIQMISGGKDAIFAIQPAALPHGAGVQLSYGTTVYSEHPGAKPSPNAIRFAVTNVSKSKSSQWSVGVGLVQASPQCTGLPAT